MFYICKGSLYTVILTSIMLLFFAGCAGNHAYKPNPVDLYVDAVQLAELNEDNRAVEKLNTAVVLNQRFSPAYSLLGEIYQQMEDYPQSAAYYEKATELNPWSFSDYFHLGRVYQIMEQFAEAVRAYVKAVELKPTHLDANMGAAES